MESSPAVSSRLIGAIFVERGLITDEQLESALAEQQRTGQRLGEVLVSSYGVPRLELASALAEQWADLERPAAGASKDAPAPPADTDAGDLRAVSGEWTEDLQEERRQIGAIFLERGLVTEDQLDGALQQQHDSGERLGEILVTQGIVTRVDLASALAEQWAELPKLRPPGAESEAPRSSVSPALAEDLRRSIAELTTRVDGVVDRVRAAGAAATDDAELAALRETVEELKTWAEDERTAGLDTRERLAEAVRRLESVDGVAVRLDDLEQRLDRDATAAVLADTAAALRHDIDALADAVQLLGDQAGSELAPLREEIAGLAGALSTRDDVSGRLAAELAGRLAALESRPEQVADSGADERTEFRASLEALTTRLDEGVAELHARLEAHAAEGFDSDAAQAEANAALTERLDELRASIESLAESEPSTDALRDDLAAELRATLDARIADLGARLDAVASVDTDLGTRVDDLAATVTQLSGASAALDALRDDLTRHLDSTVDGRFGDLRNGLESAAARDAELAQRLETLASSIEAVNGSAPALDDVRRELAHEVRALLDERLGDLNARLEAGAAGDMALAERISALGATVESLAGAAPSVDAVRAELTNELRSTLDARLGELVARLESVTTSDEDLSRRVKKLAAAVDSLAGDPPATDALRGELAGELHAALDARLGELGARLDEGAAGDAELGQRIERLAHSVAALTSTAPSVDAIRDEVTGQLHATLDARLGEVSARLDSVASGDEELSRRVRKLAASVESIAAAAPAPDALRAELTGELQAALDARLGEVSARLDSVASGDEELSRRVRKLAASVESIAAAAPAPDALRAELAGELHAAVDARLGELAARLDEGAAGDAELGQRIERLAHSVASLTSTAPSVDAIREEVTHELAALLDTRVGELDARLATSADAAGQRDDKLRKRLDRLTESLAALESATPRAETLRDEITNGLQTGLDERIGALRAELEDSRTRAAQAVEATTNQLWERVESVAAAVEPLSGTSERIDSLRHELAGDLHHALDRRIGELRAEDEVRRADDDARQVARAEADAALRERVDGLAAAVESVAGTAGAIESLRHELYASQNGAVHALQGELRSVTETVAVEAGRLIETESRLTEGVEALVHRLDAVETRVSGVETTVDETAGLDTVAREELDRLAAALGQRLDGLEHALATGGVEALRVSLEALEQRVEAQSGIVEEQARVTERAVRKGLAAIGERIADSEQAYAEAGSSLRRSVERLGWAIEDADRAIAAPVPSPEETGHVVFAPTTDGYRLVACDGIGPGVGAVLELAEVPGPVVVARVGLSPLPFDRRPCLFVEPWRPTTALDDA